MICGSIVHEYVVLDMDGGFAGRYYTSGGADAAAIALCKARGAPMQVVNIMQPESSWQRLPFWRGMGGVFGAKPTTTILQYVPVVTP